MTRPSQWLGAYLSIGLATLFYIADKARGGKLHPTQLAHLGLSHEFFELQESKSLSAAQNVLVAAAAAPPFIPGQVLDDNKAYDGGYLDSMPIGTDRCYERFDLREHSSDLAKTDHAAPPATSP